MRVCNYSNIKKIPWRIVLPDGTKLTVFTPKVGTYREIITMMQDKSEAMDLDKQIDLIADVLNSNAEGLTFTSADIDKMFGIEEYELFTSDLVEFLVEATEAVKN